MRGAAVGGLSRVTTKSGAGAHPAPLATSLARGWALIIGDLLLRRSAAAGGLTPDGESAGTTRRNAKGVVDDAWGEAIIDAAIRSLERP